MLAVVTGAGVFNVVVTVTATVGVFFVVVVVVDIMVFLFFVMVVVITFILVAVVIVMAGVVTVVVTFHQSRVIIFVVGHQQLNDPQCFAASLQRLPSIIFCSCSGDFLDKKVFLLLPSGYRGGDSC